MSIDVRRPASQRTAGRRGIFSAQPDGPIALGSDPRRTLIQLLSRRWLAREMRNVLVRRPGGLLRSPPVTPIADIGRWLASIRDRLLLQLVGAKEALAPVP